MKVLFLDHQGVMYIKKHPNVGTLDFFDPALVSYLVSLLNKLDVEIVVSSDWRFWVPFDEMKVFYKRQGIKPPIDYTTHMKKPITMPYAFHRACEINKWLEKHDDVTHWVAIDDLDMRNYLTNFVKTDPAVGLTLDKIEEVLKYLSD